MLSKRIGGTAGGRGGRGAGQGAEEEGLKGEGGVTRAVGGLGSGATDGRARGGEVRT